MLTGNRKNLSIFQNFQTDRSLPKFEKPKDKSESGSRIMMGVESSDMSNPFSFTTDGGLMSEATERASELRFFFQHLKNIKPTLKNRLRFWMANILLRIGKKEDFKAPPVDPEVFFNFVKNSFSEIKGAKQVEEHYAKNMEQAKSAGQVALMEKLKDQLNIVLSECKLKDGGIKKYVTEDQVVTFFRKLKEPENLKLSWIKNFTRVIPSDVVKLKAKADEIKVFDNYAILHYDPLNESEEMTKKEKERAKDPILFGVISGSDKLYFIADWMDEYCDLTLDKFLEELGEDALTINNKSIKSHIG